MFLHAEEEKCFLVLKLINDQVKVFKDIRI